MSPRVSKTLGLSIHSPRKCNYAILWNAYSSQASTFNHPAGISYLKRKETSHTTAFYKQYCLLQCWRMHKPIRESPGPPSIRVDSKPSQSTVGLAHQHCTAAPAAHHIEHQSKRKGPGSEVSLAQHKTAHHPREGLPWAPPFTWEEGSKQFMDHFNQLAVNSQAPVRAYFIKWSLSLSESDRKHSRNPRLNGIPGETKWNERRDKAWGWSRLKVLHTAIGLSLPLEVLSLPLVSPT